MKVSDISVNARWHVYNTESR